MDAKGAPATSNLVCRSLSVRERTEIRREPQKDSKRGRIRREARAFEHGALGLHPMRSKTPLGRVDALMTSSSFASSPARGP